MMRENQTTYLGPFYILGNNHEILPCPDPHVFAKWFAVMENRRVAHTYIKLGVHTVIVSTVFIGIDKHRDREPRGMYETRADGGPYGSGVCTVSDTWRQAVSVHDAACKHIVNFKGGKEYELPQTTE